MGSYEKLVLCIENNDWDALVLDLKPKDFCLQIPRTLEDFKKLLKVAQLLLDEQLEIPEKLRTILLKCIANSCVNGYKDKEFHAGEDSSTEKNIYKILSQKVTEWSDEGPYPFQTHFPYDGVVRWCIKTVTDYTAENKKLTEDQSETLRLSIQFLCNFFTFAFDVSTSSNAQVILDCIKDDNFKHAIIKVVGHDRPPMARAACAYVHNMVKQLFNEFYATIDSKKDLTSALIKSTMSDIQAAMDTIIQLLKKPCYLKEIYDDLSIDDRLYLLDIVLQEVQSIVYTEEDERPFWLPVESFEFLADRFKKKSDLILKTVDSYMKDLEPTEITILIDILAKVTSNPKLDECKKLQEDKSLLINCLYLLKAVHMIGKEANNCFSPIQKLGDLALNPKKGCCEEDKDDDNHLCQKKVQSHPAFGFKASLVRIIGNLSYRNEKNQNIVRENDGIPLLLDCCNIDGRNPLIIQWVTLAIRSLLESNPENQEVVRQSAKLGIVDSAIVREMGLTINDDGTGNAIGIMPLPEKKITLN